jgi:hypothetical protein
MMKKIAIAALLTALAPVSANAAIDLSSVAGPWVNPGFAATTIYDFETAAPFTGGLVTTGTVSGVRAQPWSSTGNYATVSPADGTPGILDLSAFGSISKISLLWGSIDNYNDLDVLDAGGNVLATFNGATVIAPANGDQSNPATNRLVTLTLTGSDMANAAKLQFRSSGNAFEFDNVAVQAAVPEPATWAFMIGGFGLVGSAMRRRRTAVSFA